MDIDATLEKIAEKVGKRKTDLKKTYNSILKKKKEEGLDEELLGEEGFHRLGLLGTCKRYELDPSILDRLDDEKETVEDKKEIKIEVKKEVKNMSKFFGDFEPVERPSGDGEYEKVDNLKPLLNLTYHVRLADPSEPAYEHEGIGKDGKEFKSYAMNVVVIDIIPKGKDKKHEIGAKYKLWLNPIGFSDLFRFWDEVVGAPADDRIFSLEKSEKTSKSSGRNYAVWTFGEV